MAGKSVNPSGKFASTFSLKYRYCNLSNCEKQTFPMGMEIQVFKLSSLILSYSMTKSKLDREHVTLHIRKNPKIFKQVHIKAPSELTAPHLSVTLDEIADYELIDFVIRKIE